MNRIPIVHITKAGKHIKVIEVNQIAISPIDIPAYVEVSEGGTDMSFIFPNSAEPKIVYPVTDSSSIIAGKISGRFYRVTGIPSPINGALRDKICTALTGQSRSIRFNKNIGGFVELANKARTTNR